LTVVERASWKDEGIPSVAAGYLTGLRASASLAACRQAFDELTLRQAQGDIGRLILRQAQVTSVGSPFDKAQLRVTSVGSSFDKLRVTSVGSSFDKLR
jgi:hypothetical protein